ncbi:hypothetical protein BDV95DRAFT_280509 [Massariosphaeria phaeospora]|uniref:Uncharacterized protein n=1 Tax=Massariosphaeria phaeospora TaxID=100035 RepID=A0A7C8IF96_9PLEO|nr:hypothetical protein BDV95DRAFT_280509 [Massariosphaeria phaeospora]
MAPLSSTNSYAALASAEPGIKGTSGDGTSKKARNRQRKAANKAATTADTEINNKPVVSKGTSSRSVPARSGTKVDNNMAQSKTTPDKSGNGSKVFRLTAADCAVPVTDKVLPRVKTTIPAGFGVKRSYTDPGAVIQPGVSYKDANQTKASPTAVIKASESPKHAQTSTSGPRKSSMGSDSPGSSDGSKKSWKPKPKPEVGEDGWTLIAEIVKDDSKSSTPSETPLSPKSLTLGVKANRFESLEDDAQSPSENHQLAQQVKKAKNVEQSPKDMTASLGAVLSIKDATAVPSKSFAEASKKTPKASFTAEQESVMQLGNKEVVTKPGKKGSVAKPGVPQQRVLTSDDFPEMGLPSRTIVTTSNTHSRDVKSPVDKTWAVVTTAVPSPQSAPDLVALHSCKASSESERKSKVGTVTTPPTQTVPTAADFPSILPESASRSTATITSTTWAKATMQSRSPVSTPDLKNVKVTHASPPKASAKAKAASKVPNPVVDQELSDLVHMLRPARRDLLRGPRITVWVGTQAVAGIAKRAAMAVSSVLNEHFTQNPSSLEYRFPSGAVSLAAVRVLLVKWLETPCRSTEVLASVVGSQNSFTANIALLRTARLLGMQQYTKPILGWHVGYLKNNLPEYSEIVAVESMTTSSQDPLWTSMVNYLANAQFRGEKPDNEEFEVFLSKHPKLKGAIEISNEYFASRRMEREKAQRAVFEARRQEWLDRDAARRQERLAREEIRRQEQELRWKEEKKAAASLRSKLNSTRNGNMGVTTVTQAEGAIAARLMGHR